MKIEIRFYRKEERRPGENRDDNRDPISGARGAHPVGTGIGAAAGGAATGAAVGSVAGPVGTAAGIVGGAIVGGLAGKGIAESVNPTAERDYWNQNYNRESYYQAGRTWDDYDSAYRTGYEGYGRYATQGRSWDECETDLQRDYEKNRGNSKFTWDEARPAVRAAWDRLELNWERFIGYHVVDHHEEVIGKLSALWTDDRGEPAFLGVKTGWLLGKHHVIPAEMAELDANRERIRVPFSEQTVKDAPTFDPDVELSDAEEQSIRDYFSRFGLKERQNRQPAQTTGSGFSNQGRTGQGITGKEKMGQSGDETTVKLSEEQLKVGKREVTAGGVRLRKIIRTEVVNQPVELKREELVVERVPANEATGRAQHEFQEREIYVPLRREEAVIQKEARVREEVRVRKDARTDRQNVSEQVRKEDVQIEHEGEARETRPTARR
jgi:uncharacterized protein (TIGR02271 family)